MNINREVDGVFELTGMRTKEREKSPMKEQYTSLTILITPALVTNNRKTTQDSSHRETQTTSDWEPITDSQTSNILTITFPGMCNALLGYAALQSHYVIFHL